MRDLAGGAPASCALTFNSFRLTALPPPVLTGPGRDCALLATGLAVHRDRVVPGSWRAVVGGGAVATFW